MSVVILKDMASKYGTALRDRLKQPAHRADIFRYMFVIFTTAGCTWTSVDIKCGFVVPWTDILQLLAADWGTAQMSAAQGAGDNPVPEGQLPNELLVMAIGVKEDRIFQGIIYSKPSHPLLRQAIQHAFSRQVFAAKAQGQHGLHS